MSLFGSIRLANNSLQATQIGLQVVGQNIANANTPGYIREEVSLTTAPTQQMGRLLIGLGVQVTGVQQKIDRFVEDRLRSASSDVASAETQERAYLELEGLIGELNTTDLSTSLNNFFNSIQDILNDPTADAARNLATLRGRTLTDDIQRLSSRAQEIRADLDHRVAASAADINRLLDSIRNLNIRIVQMEGSSASNSDAVGLRDQRLDALQNLAKLIDVRVDEQPNGSVIVLHQGEFLISDALARHIEIVREPNNGLPTAILQITETETRLSPASGEVAGLETARDNILGDYLADLDSFARTLSYEFNRVFSSGQGLNGYSQITSANAVSSTTIPLDAALSDLPPTTGSFEIQVYNRDTGITRRNRVQIDLDGLGSDTTLASLAAELDGLDGVAATISPFGQLVLSSDSANQQLAFADDTSGVLASLGVATFFVGSKASNLAVNQAIIDDPMKFAASKGGVGEDTDNAVILAGFQDQPLSRENQATLGALYERMVGRVTQASAVAHSVAEGFRAFQQTLNGQKLAVSGVSLDEEAVQLMTLQRIYQASARYIATLNDLLNVLVNL